MTDTPMNDVVSLDELKEILNLLNAMTATSKGDKASDGKGKYLGDGLPRKTQYQLRTGTLASVVQELISQREKQSTVNIEYSELGNFIIDNLNATEKALFSYMLTTSPLFYSVFFWQIAKNCEPKNPCFAPLSQLSWDDSEESQILKAIIEKFYQQKNTDSLLIHY